MADFSTDPVQNAIQNGIKEDIACALEHDRWRAAIILIYAGMDAMAYLDMPAGQDDVTRVDFVRWADRFLRFPCIEQIGGADFYGARCAVLHAYGAVSRMSRAGQCRVVGYMDKSIPAVRFDRAISPDLVMVSIPALKDAFFAAVDAFLVAAFADKAKAAVIEERLLNLIVVFKREGHGL